MLNEIYCEQFHNKKIKFNEGLNVVLGTDDGYNSIGKSTFLLIVDFVFGGDTYAMKDDIINNVKNHDIFFTFKFDNTFYKFCRNNIQYREVWICDENYKKIEPKKIEEFREWLDTKYQMQLPDLSFRDAIGRYIRVYGKNNYDENNPLHGDSKEKQEKAILALIKLFDAYSPIKEAKAQADDISAKLKAFKSAQKFNYIDKIKKSEYNSNIKRINFLNNELQQLSNQMENQIIGNDLSGSQEALEYKNLLSNARRERTNLKTKYNVINNNQDYKFPLTTNTYVELNKYFPNVELKEIEKVETFHNKISKIFKDELLEEKNNIYKTIQEYDIKITDYEKHLRELLNDTNIPKKILQQHTEILKELEILQNKNNAFKQRETLMESKKECDILLKDLKTKQYSLVQTKINNKMQKLNDYVYGGAYNSPILNLSNNKYKFFTPNDTGTGMAYKGLIIFDLAILSLTKLPILVHDSIILKQIYDNAIEKILELYINSKKQIVIAFDKQNSYTPKVKNILENNAILKLAPNGEQLFGRAWGKKI